MHDTVGLCIIHVPSLPCWPYNVFVHTLRIARAGYAQVSTIHASCLQLILLTVHARLVSYSPVICMLALMICAKAWHADLATDSQ